ncbi:MAG: transporter substrate-binding domain-containing protein [Alphaproteobacteria bacterium]|nr:transporter substrate-binding domain-containing protein [Alphaproteobacteria bacterium]
MRKSQLCKFVSFVDWLSPAALLFFPLFLFSAASAQEIETLSLSSAERAVLEKHGKIRLAVDIDWAPFEFVDSEKVYRGMAAEYIALVEKRLGISFDVDKERPWPKMVKAVENRDLDAFSLVVRTPQRDAFVNFTKPYISFPMVIVTLDSGLYVDGVRDLRNRTVAVVKSYASHDLIAKDYPDLKLHLAKNAREGLEAVSHGQADAFIGNLAVASQVMREFGVTNLKISGQTEYRFELAMAVRKDWPALIPILQKALDSITDEERDAIYNQWIRVKFEETVDYRIILSVLGVGTIIVLITLFWNRRLKREVEQRKAAENHIRALFNNVVDGIVSFDENGVINRINPAGERIFDFSKDEIVGENVVKFIPAAKECVLIDAGAGPGESELEKSISMEVEGRHKDGTEFPLDFAISKLSVQGTSMSVGIFRDITDRKEVERLKSEFVSTVSHELRTPLTSIKGSLGLITQGAGDQIPDQWKSMIDIAYRNSDRLTLLVNDILDIEKLDAGLMTFEMAPISIREFIEEAVETNKGYGEERKIGMKIVSSAPLAMVEGDRNRLMQVMANILSNAAKFSPENTDVELWVEARDDSVIICIKDYGPGIPEEFQSKLYDRFTQADSSNTRVKGGTGLGMSITKTIVEAHSGDLRFETGPNIGTTFFVELPASGRADQSNSDAEPTKLGREDDHVMEVALGD